MRDEVTTYQKLFVLALLVIQNASTVIMARYSRAVLKEDYLSSSVVIATEFTKIAVSAFCISQKIGHSHLNSKPWSLLSKFVWLIQNSGYTWIPAACYFLQNTLQYQALENLSAPVYGVMAQMKILTAAILSYAFLSKQLSLRKWRALILLVVGAVLMENHNFEINEDDDFTTKNTSDPVRGTFAIVTIVITSGVAGVITQKLLQNKSQHGSPEPQLQLSLWDRNFQMGFWSVVIGFSSFVMDREWIANHGSILSGWTINTVILVFLWGIGGILVAITIKYTDVIVKGFASAISLIVISILGSLLLNDLLDLIFGLGAMITIIATFNYNESDTRINTQINTPLNPTNIDQRLITINENININTNGNKIKIGNGNGNGKTNGNDVGAIDQLNEEMLPLKHAD